MNPKLFNSNIFKGDGKALTKKVTVGGLDFDQLPSKAEMVRLLVEEATESAHDLASSLLTSTKQKIEDIEQAAYAEAQHIREEAYAQAYQDGYEQGFDEGFSEGSIEATEKVDEVFAALMAEIGNVLFEIETERRECLDSEEVRVKTFISKLATKLIKRDLSYEPESFLELVRQSIARLEHKAEVKMFLHSASAQKFKQIKERVIAECPGLESLSIEADDSLEAGSFILESGRERLDLRLDSQIDHLIEEIL